MAMNVLFLVILNKKWHLLFKKSFTFYQQGMRGDCGSAESVVYGMYPSCQQQGTHMSQNDMDIRGPYFLSCKQAHHPQLKNCVYLISRITASQVLLNLTIFTNKKYLDIHFVFKCPHCTCIE